MPAVRRDRNGCILCRRPVQLPILSGFLVLTDLFEGNDRPPSVSVRRERNDVAGNSDGGVVVPPKRAGGVEIRFPIAQHGTGLARGCRRVVVWMEHLVNRLVDELLGGEAEDVCCGLVDEGDEAGRIYGENTVMGGVTDNVN